MGSAAMGDTRSGAVVASISRPPSLAAASIRIVVVLDPTLWQGEIVTAQVLTKDTQLTAELRRRMADSILDGELTVFG